MSKDDKGIRGSKTISNEGSTETLYTKDGKAIILTVPPLTLAQLQQRRLSETYTYFCNLLTNITSAANWLGSQRIPVDPESDYIKNERESLRQEFRIKLSDLEEAYRDLLNARFDITKEAVARDD